MPTALYRRYRPESFADVIGQEHVTAPLMQALRMDRTNHAYLFSGPRGCGKTTSARILARCLNCEQGPTDTPCGVCDSCRDLSRDGGGSLDVVEIDAASHGGVDDARELRERAAIAPARDRFKIFIVDEAHMVTNQGFNAMLKLVEEPPAHVKFVFATTEPDKVLPTIRSRTHHYPFHLVAPNVLSDYLTSLCEAEKVPVGPGVIPLVVRAGGGSVRDSLSVLDQLMAGADESGLDQARAAALLGFTEGSLLDDVMNALAAVDGAALFGIVDKVLSTGQDPRRFVEDLLTRLRDLIVVAALQERAETVLRGYPQDQLERLAGQASNFRPAELSRAADVVNDALADMVGASGPRIQLELLCARLLLPAVDGAAGYGARLDRVERVLSSGVPAPAQASPARPQPSAPEPTPAQSVREAPQPPVETPARQAERPIAPEPAALPQPQRREPAPREEPVTREVPQSAPEPAAAPTAGGDNTEMLRRFWPDIMNAVRKSSRATWSILNEQAQVLSCDGGKLTLGIANPGALRMFVGRSSHAENLAKAAQAQTNLVVQVEAVPFERGSAAAQPSTQERPAEPRQPEPKPQPQPEPARPAQNAAPVRQEPQRSEARGPVVQEEPAGWGDEPPFPDEPPYPDPADHGPDDASPQPTPTDGRERQYTPQTATEEPLEEPPGWGAPSAAAPDTQEEDRPGPVAFATGPEQDMPQPVPTTPGRPSRAEQMAQAARRQFNENNSTPEVEDVISADDPDAEDAGVVGQAVVERVLGGKVINDLG